MKRKVMGTGGDFGGDGDWSSRVTFMSVVSEVDGTDVHVCYQW